MEFSALSFAARSIYAFLVVATVNSLASNLANSGAHPWLCKRLRCGQRHEYAGSLFQQLLTPVLTAAEVYAAFFAAGAGETSWQAWIEEGPVRGFLFPTLCGYFIADCLFHWRQLSLPLRAHHIGFGLSCLVVEAETQWRGLMLLGTALMETGSLFVNLGDVGIVSPRTGASVLVWTSVLPILWHLHVVVRAPPRSIGRVWLFILSVVGNALRVRFAALVGPVPWASKKASAAA